MKNTAHGLGLCPGRGSPGRVGRTVAWAVGCESDLGNEGSGAGRRQVGTCRRNQEETCWDESQSLMSLVMKVVCVFARAVTDIVLQVTGPFHASVKIPVKPSRVVWDLAWSSTSGREGPTSAWGSDLAAPPVNAAGTLREVG